MPERRCQGKRTFGLACRPVVARCVLPPLPCDAAESYALLVGEVTASPHHAALALSRARQKAAAVPRLQGEVADLWASLAAAWVTCLRVARERDRAQADLEALLEVTLG